MDPAEIRRVVSQIDAAIREQPWMDFEVRDYAGSDLAVRGTLDPSSGSDHLEITFSGVFAVSMPMEWRTETSEPVFRILDGDEARDVNLRFGVVQGNTVFGFKPEDSPDLECLVAAQGVAWRLRG
jgi:hypothetical protein